MTAGVGYLMQDSTVSRGNFDGYHVTTGVVISFTALLGMVFLINAALALRLRGYG